MGYVVEALAREDNSRNSNLPPLKSDRASLLIVARTPCAFASWLSFDPERTLTDLQNASTAILKAIAHSGAASGVGKSDCLESTIKLRILAVGGGAEGI